MVDDPSQSVADPQVSDPDIIPPAESASSDPDRPVSTILADPPIEPKTPLADPGSDYTIPPTVPDESIVATESASIASSPSDIPADLQTTVPSESPVATQSATVPTEAQREVSPPTSPPELVEGGSIQDSLPPDQPSQVQPEVPVNAPSPEAFQTQEIPSQSAEIKPEAPQGTQNAPLADFEVSILPKTSFGDLTSDQPKPISSPVSPQLPQAPISSPSAPNTSFGDLIGKPPVEEPTINIEPIEPPKPVQSRLPTEASAKEGISPLSPQTPTETIVEAKADFSAKRQQALQTRRKKREDHLAKILTLISQKGKIKNKDICDFLRVSQSTATNYLHSLVKDGKIKKEGKAKATTYSL